MKGKLNETIEVGDIKKTPIRYFLRLAERFQRAGNGTVVICGSGPGASCKSTVEFHQTGRPPVKISERLQSPVVSHFPFKPLFRAASEGLKSAIHAPASRMIIDVKPK